MKTNTKNVLMNERLQLMDVQKNEQNTVYDPFKQLALLRLR